MSAYYEVPLGRAPELGLTILAHAGDTGMRLNVALMYRFGVELALDDDVGLRKPGVHIAVTELHPLGDVGRFFRHRLDPSRE